MSSIRGGFTVVEVLIALAVSGMLLFAALTLFRGKQNQTQFNQAMYDLESKVQSITNEVKSGSFEDTGNYTCEFRTGFGTPRIEELSGSGSGTNTDCLTLGRAIQVVNNDDTISIYTVVGLRNIWSGNTDTGVPVSSIEETMPEPVSNTHALSSADLTTEFNLPGGASVVSSKVSGLSGEYDIIGFYLSPQGGSSAGQGSNFTGQAFSFTSTSTGNNSPKEPGSENCIRQQAPAGCQNPVVLGQWDLCIRSADDNRRALLSTMITSAGLTTKLTFDNCT